MQCLAGALAGTFDDVADAVLKHLRQLKAQARDAALVSHGVLEKAAPCKGSAACMLLGGLD